MRAFDPAARRLVVDTSKIKRSPDFIALLQRLDGLDGPRPGLPIKAVVIMVDNGPIHMSKAARAALAAGAHWLTVEWLPKYTPEFNDTEPVWRDSKPIICPTRPSPTPMISTSQQRNSRAVTTLNTERNISPLVKQRVSAMK